MFYRYRRQQTKNQPRRFAWHSWTTFTCLFGVATSLHSGVTAAPPEQPTNLATRTGQDWPSFLGPSRDSKSTATGLAIDGKAWQLPVIWTVPLGTGYAACAVRLGRCFVFDRIDDTARLRCLHAETGKTLWTYKYSSQYEDMYGFDNGPRCSPVVDENRVYVYGAEGELHCVAVHDGTKLWSRNLNEEYNVIQNFFGVGSTPLVVDDLLLVMVGGSPDADSDVAPGQLDRVTPNGSCLVAFDKRTGAEVYKSVDDLASYASLQLAPIQGVPHVLLFGRSGLWLVKVRDGKPSQLFPFRAKKLESVNASTPVVVGNETLITESYEPGGAVIRWQDSRWQPLWQDKPHGRKQSFAAHWMTPVHHDGHVYGCSGQSPQEADFRCIEWNSGKVRWTKPGGGRVSVLYLDQHLLCLSERGGMELLKATPESCDVVCSVELVTSSPNATEQKQADEEPVEPPLIDYPAWAAPVLARGLLYVRGKSNLVCAELIP